MHYFWWIPTVFFYYVLYGWVSRQSAHDPTIWQKSKWFWLLIIMGACPWWAIVSRVTNNLVFDAFLYDFLMLIGFYVMLLVVGSAEHFNKLQWLGAFLTISGFILMRCNFK